MKLVRILICLLFLPALQLVAQAPATPAPVDDMAQCAEMAKFAGVAIRDRFHIATLDKSKAVVQNPPVTSCYVEVKIDIRH